MDKLYYIVCEEKGATLFEGKFQGQTRGMAMKFLKERIGRPSLAGTVFTITEIPVPVIREIVREILRGEPVTVPAVAAPMSPDSAEVPEGEARIIALPAQAPAEAPPPAEETQPEKPERFDAFGRQNMHPVQGHDLDGEPAEVPPTMDGETDWKAARRFYQKCRSPKKVADRFRVPIDTIKSLVRRWKR